MEGQLVGIQNKDRYTSFGAATSAVSTAVAAFFCFTTELAVFLSFFAIYERQGVRSISQRSKVELFVKAPI